MLGVYEIVNTMCSLVYVYIYNTKYIIMICYVLQLEYKEYFPVWNPLCMFFICTVA